METIREFRVETNAYSAEFGRNSGGQINVLTKSGTNRLRGSAYEFHRNDALDARNYFDALGKPDFTRNQFGGTVGGPLVQDRLVLLRRLRGADRAAGQDDLDDRARRQRAARHPARPAPSASTPRSRPISRSIPRANGPSLGQGLAMYTFPFDQRLTSTSSRAGSTTAPARGHQFFAPLHVRRCRAVPADRLSAVSAHLPVAQPVLHRASTGEVLSDSDAEHGAARLQPHAHRPGSRGQHLDNRCAPFVPGATIMGDIDIGGLQRFGPQSSATCGWRRTCSAARTTSCTRAAVT